MSNIFWSFKKLHPSGSVAIGKVRLAIFGHNNSNLKDLQHLDGILLVLGICLILCTNTALR